MAICKGIASSPAKSAGFLAMTTPRKRFLKKPWRDGHATMETFLLLNGYEIRATADEQERVILDVAAGTMGREAFTEWIRNHLQERAS